MKKQTSRTYCSPPARQTTVAKIRCFFIFARKTEYSPASVFRSPFQGLENDVPHFGCIENKTCTFTFIFLPAFISLLYLCKRKESSLGYGVMVTLQILVLSFLVRVQIAQLLKRHISHTAEMCLFFIASVNFSSDLHSFLSEDRWGE